ncbi:hypothetical protein J6590_015932 [Homalodisca vitripennis]|nr:hypothetical protein J6590_015932 [Homalodisca vitripennis]
MINEKERIGGNGYVSPELGGRSRGIYVVVVRGGGHREYCSDGNQLLFNAERGVVPVPDVRCARGSVKDRRNLRLIRPNTTHHSSDVSHRLRSKLCRHPRRTCPQGGGG